jgi:hypothetical protein
VISRHSGCARFVDLSRRATKHVAWSAASLSNRLKTLNLPCPFTNSFLRTPPPLQSITLDTGANLQGRALALNAAVTFDTYMVTAP